MAFIKIKYFNFSVASPAAVPYLSTLTTQQLDELGLKAVNAGAEPAKLQQVRNIYLLNRLFKMDEIIDFVESLDLLSGV